MRAVNIVDHEYMLGELIGVGGTAHVYTAEDPGKTRVAVKMLHPDLVVDPGMVTRLLEQGTAARQLSHDNVVRVLERGAPPSLGAQYRRGRRVSATTAWRARPADIDARRFPVKAVSRSTTRRTDRYPMHTTNQILIAAAVVGALAACGTSQPSAKEDGGPAIADGGPPIVDGGLPIVDGGPPIVDAPPFTRGVSTLAGAGEAGFTDGDRNVARFNNPVNVAYGSDGRVYVADFDNNKIRAVGASGNVTTIVAQNGFMRPFGLAFAPDGTLFVSTDNDKNGAHNLMSGSVWRVDLHSGTATIVANAIGRPRGIAVLGDGRLALSDDLHHVVRVLDPRTGVIADLAGAWDATGYADGAGAAARFSTPYGIAVRHDGGLVVVDQGNDRLRLVGLDGSVTTLAGAGPGHADGALAQARFDHPQAVVVATDGSIYVTDDNNFCVRKLYGDTVTTVIGDGTAGYKDTDDLLAAELFGIEGLALSGDGKTLYIADGNRGNPLPYNRIRTVNLTN